MTDADVKQLTEIFRSANLKQHLQERSRGLGHILDFVISHENNNLIGDVSVSCRRPFIPLLILVYFYGNNLCRLIVFYAENTN